MRWTCTRGCEAGLGDPCAPAGRRAGVWRALLALALLAGGGGCAGDATTTAPRDAAGAFWRMTLNHRAVTLSTVAPYDTVRLVATPRDARGAALPPAAGDSLVTTLRPVDPTDTSLVLGPGGLVRAHAPGTGARVVVTARLGAVVRTDTVAVNVTAEPHPPRLARLVLAAIPTDTMSMTGFILTPDGVAQPVVSAQAVDTAGRVITPVPVAFWSADTTLAMVDPSTGQISVPSSPYRRGRVMLYASTTAYGVTRTDSIPITVIPPVLQDISVMVRFPSGSPKPVRYFTPATATVAAGAIVRWYYSADEALNGDPMVDVVFDDPEAARELRLSDSSPFAFLMSCDPGGRRNIPAFAPDPTKPCNNQHRVRVFATPGTYHYHSRRHGTGGTIVVVP